MKTDKLVLLLVVLLFVVVGMTAYLAYSNKASKTAAPAQNSPSAENAKKTAAPTTNKKYTEEEVAEAIEYCKNVDFIISSPCFGNIAAVLNDASICDNNLEYDLNGFCHSAVAMEQKNAEACKTLPQADKEKCYALVARVTADASVCDRIPVPYADLNAKDDCYREAARTAQDESICPKITDTWYKDWCYANVAVAKLDISICDRSSDQDAKDECWSNLAEAKSDLSICEAIAEAKNRDDCYIDLARSMKRSDLCDRLVARDYLKDNCYHSVAYYMKDPKICEKIADESYRENCVSWAE
ncbi:MAG: hypothetical protein MUD10_05660 [Candidatus Pacebacteria bacterium]|nr:hypothetical protein [Candidatus Paceibacterota bacterium]